MNQPSYGETIAEHMAIHESVARVDGRFEAVRVSGSDTVSFLDGILSQDIAAMEPGSVARSLLLQPQGKLTAVLWVLRDDEACVLLADPGYGSVTAAELARFRLRVDAEIEEVDAPVSLVIGPEAELALTERGLPALEGWTAHGAALVAKLPLETGPSAFVIIDPPAALDDLTRAGRVAYDAYRAEIGEPVMGVDLDEKTIPQESGLVPGAVSFTKGCFLGQELVARIDSRGHVNRRLMAVSLTTNVVPPPGASVFAADKEVGAISSPSESPELRAPIALAMLRREVEAGDTVEVRWDGGASSAVVHDLPTRVFTDF